MIQVVAGLFIENDRFMVCQRPITKKRGLLWEFVGGKVEPNESKEQALIRECREELGINVKVGKEFMTINHEYPDISITLTVFYAYLEGEKPKLLEHNAIKWITRREIDDFEFCPADKDILEKIKKECYF